MAKAKFLNVDLHLHTRSYIPKLIAALGRGVFVLHGESYRTTFEVATGRGGLSIDQTIAAFYTAYRGLDAENLRRWNNCKSRIFSIGIECGTRPEQHQANFSLSAKSIARILEMRGVVDLTLYSAFEEELPTPPKGRGKKRKLK